MSRSSTHTKNIKSYGNHRCPLYTKKRRVESPAAMNPTADRTALELSGAAVGESSTGAGVIPLTGAGVGASIGAAVTGAGVSPADGGAEEDVVGLAVGAKVVLKPVGPGDAEGLAVGALEGDAVGPKVVGDGVVAAVGAAVGGVVGIGGSVGAVVGKSVGAAVGLVDSPSVTALTFPSTSP
jgi:hypothetical protein